MISSNFTLKLSDIEKYEEMKNSSAYRSYVQEITQSPVFKMITEEYIKYVDSTEDIAKLQKDMKLTPEELNKVFKNSISKITVGIVADTILMKEIIDVGIDDTKEDLDSNFMTTYILGLADKKFYDKAEEILEKEPDTNSVLYKGYREYIKRNSKKTGKTEILKEKTVRQKQKKEDKKTEKIDITTEEIRL